ncbi:MAG TPA: hypothetical protein DCS05_04830 [Nitrospiraceae bacterium]|nr:hypothetical protein [Nitrospiraceae bacterium]
MKYRTSLDALWHLGGPPEDYPSREEQIQIAIAERLEAIADAVGRVADHLGAQMAEEQAKLDAIAGAAQAQAEEEARDMYDHDDTPLF